MKNYHFTKWQAVQTGYILPFVLILLVALILSSAAFFNRSVISTQLSGFSKDSAQSQQLAESAINRFQGRFLSGLTSPTPSTITPINDIDADLVRLDRDHISAVLPSLTAGPTGALPVYVFYAATAAGALPVVAPGTTTQILQAVADGAAHGQAVLAPTDAGFVVPAAGMSIDSMFINAPTKTALLWCGVNLTPNNAPVTDLHAAESCTTADWSAANAEKVAVWMEIVADTANQKLHLYAEAVAQVGNAKTYLQRKMASIDYNPGSTLGSMVAPLAESGNRF
ncbi:MAG: hypothetical protein ABL915_09215 [Gallionella sp.]